MRTGGAADWHLFSINYRVFLIKLFLIHELAINMPVLSHILEEKLARSFGYDHAIMTGRARSGLVALIEILGQNGARPVPVFLPENICPVLVTAIRAGGGCAVTVPVSDETGLPEDGGFVAAMKQYDVRGIVMPVHLYGFEGDYPQTVQYARQAGWFILENDANAVRFNSARSAFGDALLVSFGYAKPIEAGAGGALLTNDPALARSIQGRLAQYDRLGEKALAQEADCMLERRVLRQKDELAPEQRQALLTQICDRETALSRFRFNEKDRENILDKVEKFPEEKARRLEHKAIWDRALSPLDDVLYPIALEQVVPWRVIRRAAHGRDDFARALWANKLDAGINYRSLWRELPPSCLSGERADSDVWGRTVLNLWLIKAYDRNRIMQVVNQLRRVRDDHENNRRLLG